MVTNKRDIGLNDHIYVKNDVDERLTYYMDRMQLAENPILDDSAFLSCLLDTWHRLLQILRR